MAKKTTAPETADTDGPWTTVILPPKKGLIFNFDDLWNYRYLMYLFVRRDFVTAYKQMILGPFWFVIQPLMTTGLYSVIFAGFAKIPTDQVPPPLFYLLGQIIWSFFSSVLMTNATVLSSNIGLFSKVYFPRLAVPLANSFSKLYQFGIQLVLVLVVFFIYLFSGAKIQPNWWLLAIPLAMAQLFLLGLGVGLWLSAWTVKYRDLSVASAFLIGLWMWASPIVYPASFITNEPFKTLLWLNPVSQSIELFRIGFTGTGTVELLWILYSWVVTVGLFLIGYGLFNRAERTYIDVA